MRVRARVAGLGGALAMVASLSGCITVHGETAVVPAATQEEAQRALDRFLEVYNEAYRDYDPALSEQMERGPMGAIDHAVLRAQHEVNPEGNQDFEPLKLADTTFHIPQQSGWPKFFLADSTSEDGASHLLQVFTRDSIEEDWLSSYLAVLPGDQIPEFAEDQDGYLQDLPVDGGTDSGLAIAPGQLATAYSGYLQEEEGPFAAGPYTSGLLDARAEENSSVEFEMSYQDERLPGPDNAPVAMRTADGGAVVMFSTRHFDLQNVRPGYTPSVDPLVEALMEGTAESSVTRTWVGMQTALVPEGEGEVNVIGRRAGVISAEGG